jgi:hypothetical protein
MGLSYTGRMTTRLTAAPDEGLPATMARHCAEKVLAGRAGLRLKRRRLALFSAMLFVD